MGYEAKTERYDKMTYHKAGRTGLRLPAISLGLWYQFGAAYSPENARSMLRAAFDAGIVHLIWPTITARRPAPLRRCSGAC